MTRKIDIYLNQPLHLQIKRIEAELAGRADDERVLLCGVYNDKWQKRKLIDEVTVKALMFSYQLNDYWHIQGAALVQAQLWTTQLYSNSQYDPSLALLTLGIDKDLPPTFTLAEITKTESNFFTRNWGKFTAALTLPTAVVGGGLAALFFLTAVVPPVGLAIWAAIGIGAGIAFVASAIAAGFTYLVNSDIEQDRLNQQEIQIIEAKPFVKRMLELANNEEQIKAQIKGAVEDITQKVAEFNNKIEDLKAFPKKSSNFSMFSQVDDWQNDLAGDETSIDDKVKQLYAEMYKYTDLTTKQYIDKCVYSQFDQIVQFIASSSGQFDYNTLLNNVKKNIAEDYIRNKFNELVNIVKANTDLSESDKQKRLGSIEEKRKSLITNLSDHEPEFSLASSSKKKTIKGWVTSKPSAEIMREVNIADKVMSAYLIENVIDALYHTKDDGLAKDYEARRLARRMQFDSDYDKEKPIDLQQRLADEKKIAETFKQQEQDAILEQCDELVRELNSSACVPASVWVKAAKSGSDASNPSGFLSTQRNNQTVTTVSPAPSSSPATPGQS